MRLYRSRLARPLRPALRRLKRSRAGARIARSPWFPLNWRSTFLACKTLVVDYAHLRAVAAGRPIDAQGRPVPWYTYPAIEFLSQSDFSNARIFEYGCGNSTLFWSAIAREVVAVEDEESWYREMLPLIPVNCRLLCEPDLERFVKAIDAFESFDVVIVDGPARGGTRLKCARAALGHLQKGGMIILDNADWLPESTALLRDSGLLQVDMTGFSPINSFTGTTSFFFERSWELPHKGRGRPMPGVGARSYNWEPSGIPAGRQVRCGDEVFGGVTLEDHLVLDLEGRPAKFRIIAYELRHGGAAMAIIDDDRRRVLVTKHQPQIAGKTVEDRFADESRRLRAMSASEFTEFINLHPWRRYRL
jgi:hypothetical protein